jgi:hypothetical protein
MTQETELAFDIINKKLLSAKKSPVILSWDDAETIKAALSQARASVGKGEVEGADLEMRIFAEYHNDYGCFPDEHGATSQHDYIAFKRGYKAALASKPVEVGELASDIRKACAVPAINYAMKDGAIDWEAMANGQATAAAQAILNKYNVTEK